jgi:hypothetical protein
VPLYCTLLRRLSTLLHHILYKTQLLTNEKPSTCKSSAVAALVDIIKSRSRYGTVVAGVLALEHLFPPVEVWHVVTMILLAARIWFLHPTCSAWLALYVLCTHENPCAQQSTYNLEAPAAAALLPVAFVINIILA